MVIIHNSPFLPGIERAFDTGRFSFPLLSAATTMLLCGLTNYKQDAIVLGIDLTVAADSDGSVGRANG